VLHQRVVGRRHEGVSGDPVDHLLDAETLGVEGITQLAAGKKGVLRHCLNYLACTGDLTPLHINPNGKTERFVKIISRRFTPL
jgi:hypothetical protein